MFIIQYPMQFSGPPRILTIHFQHRFAQANGGSTDTTRVHALLLSAKHYWIMSRVEDRDIHNFTLTGNWTLVKPLHRSSKQPVSRRNNWAINSSHQCVFSFWFYSYIWFDVSADSCAVRIVDWYWAMHVVVPTRQTTKFVFKFWSKWFKVLWKSWINE